MRSERGLWNGKGLTSSVGSPERPVRLPLRPPAASSLKPWEGLLSRLQWGEGFRKGQGANLCYSFNFLGQPRNRRVKSGGSPDYHVTHPDKCHFTGNGFQSTLQRNHSGFVGRLAVSTAFTDRGLRVLCKRRLVPNALEAVGVWSPFVQARPRLRAGPAFILGALSRSLVSEPPFCWDPGFVVPGHLPGLGQKGQIQRNEIFSFHLAVCRSLLKQNCLILLL